MHEETFELPRDGKHATLVDNYCSVCRGWHRAERQPDGTYRDVEVCPEIVAFIEDRDGGA